jgi:hypothetical protein
VTFIPHDCEDMDAFSAWHAKRPIVFLIDHKGSTSRLRFGAAHELGHLVMHADVVAGSPELERQANRFASAFLLPRETFLPECPRRLNWPHFYELKRRWKVSVAALVRRAYDLECISEASYPSRLEAAMTIVFFGENTNDRVTWYFRAGGGTPSKSTSSEKHDIARQQVGGHGRRCTSSGLTHTTWT